MTPEQEKKLDDIHTAVIGNESLGHEGLVRIVRRHEIWINDAKVRIAAIIGGATVAGVLVNRAWEWLVNRH